MNLSFQVTPKELWEVLLSMVPVRPVFIWGAPGIGKLVYQPLSPAWQSGRGPSDH